MWSGLRRRCKGITRLFSPGVIPSRHINTRARCRTKRPRRTISEEAANHALTRQAPQPGPEAEANMRHAPDTALTEEADRLCATHSEVESAMNQRRRRT